MHEIDPIPVISSRPPSPSELRALPEERGSSAAFALGAATAASLEAGPSARQDLVVLGAEPTGAREACVDPSTPARPAAQVRASVGQSAAASAALADAWRALQRCVRARIDPQQFATWFTRAALVHADAERVRLAVQNPFTRDWLQTYYRDVIVESIAEVFGSPRALEFAVDSELLVSATTDDLPENTAALRGSSTQSGRLESERDDGGHAGAARGGRNGPASAGAGSSGLSGTGARRAVRPLLQEGHLVSDIGLNPKYTFDNFVVGPCNRFAHAAAVGAAEQPGKAYNPFFLHGSVGLGKTHLLQSLCFTLLQRNPDTRILYLSCETFVNHFISALENGDLQKFRHKYRTVDVLVVDDIHLLANKERTQEEFFHTFNTIYQAGKQIVLSSDSPPKDIPTLQDRLVSRFRWGLVTEIEPPCYETRMAILKRKSREKGREIPDDVARLLSERIDSNIRELEGAVTKLIGYSNVSGAPITPDLVREVLRDVFAKRKGQPSMDDIIEIVVEHYGVKLSELQSRKRTNAIAHPRQIAMYLARQITRHSLEEIGGYFGGRDHSTVLYAVEKVAEAGRQDAAVQELLDGFLGRLRG